MDSHSAEAIVITCIDFRFQEYINKYIAENFKPGTYDRGAFAGAAKSLDTILDQIDIAVRLHYIKKAVLINHEDCGAYGSKGHVDHHVRDLHRAAKTIKERFPNLKVETYYLHLNGTLDKLDKNH
ncbi:MAG: carbonic anhydrase [Patescibacteria group bacterium]